MPENAIIVLNAEQMWKIIRESQPHNTELLMLFEDLVKEYDGKCIGYGLAEVTCSYCGNEQRDIFPVPMKFPSECGNCHKMGCYAPDEILSDIQK